MGRQVPATLALCLFGLIGCVGYYERAYQRLGRAHDSDLAGLRSFRWERPVLRGSGGDGNAADEVYAALANWKPLDRALRDSLAEKVFYGRPLAAAEADLIEARAIPLRALRAATQQRWSRTDLVPERGTDMLVPPYPRVIEAALALLADATNAGAEVCLQTAADVIRIGQDIVPAAPLEAASTSMHLTALAARVITHCAAGADLATLRHASHELQVLAMHPPPTGSCIEIEEIAEAMDLRRRAALTNKPSAWSAGATLLERPKLLAAWAAHEGPARFRQITPDKYPDALEDWRREQDFRLEENQDMASESEHVLSRLHDDLRGQALLRMLAVAVATLAERAYRGSLPGAPAALREPGLHDPYRNQAFNYHISQGNNAELTLWSVGEDFRDDGGSDEWIGSAQRDVTLHFPLHAKN